jgi:hypothetical protein
VEVVGRSCLSSAHIDALVFQSPSKLKRIEEYCFGECQMRVLVLLKHVGVIDRFAFIGSEVEKIFIQENDHVIGFPDNFLSDLNEKKAIRYFGSDPM